ncbi:MAG: hypothetical protein CVU59_11425 [Deltaproteobacteria bacterium HGW-Deltaproteobacteria-17]|nr:MAG: hypothetical protein CVU59_11425 [Deltaproteobacteria bacterium HGW-Deltaproteobacteria-17]
MQVSGLTSGVTQIACGNAHSCVAKSDGSAWCWGNNGFGQLGDGTTTQRLTPTQVSGMTSGVSQIATGSSHTCLAKFDGSVWCWGGNWGGQLGDGTTSNRSIPVPVSGLVSETFNVVGGYNYSCAIKTDGSAWCWGWNSLGQLGDGTTIQRLVPTQVKGMTSGVSKIAAGANNGGSPHTCAVKTDGTAWCWGNNSSGQLGDGTTTNRYSPTQVLFESDLAP